MKLTGLKVVVFDLDDTLCSEKEYVFSGYAAVARWLRERYEASFDVAARMRELFETADRRKVFDQILIEMGQEPTQELIQAMIRCYRTHEPAIDLFDDAKRALQRWQGRFQLSLISDGPLEMQERKVAALGLEKRFSPIILTGGWGDAYYKPHHRAYEQVEQAHGVAGSSCLYIGDNPAKDFVACNQRRWRSIRIRRPGGIYAQHVSAEGGAAEYDAQSLDEIDVTS